MLTQSFTFELCTSVHCTSMQSQMTDVPDNRTSQMAEFKQIEEVYKILLHDQDFNISRIVPLRQIRCLGSNGGSGYNNGGGCASGSCGGSGYNDGSYNGGSGYNDGSYNGGSGYNNGGNGGSGYNGGCSSGTCGGFNYPGQQQQPQQAVNLPGQVRFQAVSTGKVLTLMGGGCNLVTYT